MLNRAGHGQLQARQNIASKNRLVYIDWLYGKSVISEQQVDRLVEAGYDFPVGVKMVKTVKVKHGEDRGEMLFRPENYPGFSAALPIG